MSIDRLLSAAKAASLYFATFAFLSANGAASPGPSGVSVTPTALVFGNQTVGAASAAQTVAITNSKNNSLSISSIALSGDYTQTNTCRSSLPSGATCTIAITFAPTAAGARTGTLTITDNGPKSPQGVSLSGTGIGIPMAALSTSSLNFGNQNVGTSSSAQTLTLSNTGSAPLSLSSIAVSGDFSQTNNCGSSLAVGSSCQITVTLTPTLAGTRTGSLTITDNATGSPQTVALSGMGLAPLNGSNITAIWANEGGDKVTEDELRASKHVENLTGSVINRPGMARVFLCSAHITRSSVSIWFWKQQARRRPAM